MQYGTFPAASSASKSSVSIRGLGANGTLFLVDGRRETTFKIGFVNQFTPPLQPSGKLCPGLPDTRYQRALYQ
jgi:hypothetical protein